MTDAEKMREAAALLPCPFCGCTTINTVVQDDHTKWHECDWCQAVGPVEQPSADPPESWNRRALPVEASAPAADCQQAGLVTVDAGLLDEVKAALREIIKTDRIYGVRFGRGEREAWHDGDSGVIARAALARLEREVG